ncbi:MAG: hypothetical protein GY953_16650 [bacterium]|nr:hypothetical protein [bacterium]
MRQSLVTIDESPATKACDGANRDKADSAAATEFGGGHETIQGLKNSLINAGIDPDSIGRRSGSRHTGYGKSTCSAA